MSIRVHELAKEFKISTAALKKHLSDMGVEVKSHMSPVDEEVVTKIRAKFNEEVEAVKQRQKDRNLYHKKIILAEQKKKEELIEHDKQVKQAEQLKEEKPEVPVFVEKQIKKAPKRVPQKKEGGYKESVRKPVVEKKELPDVVVPPSPDSIIQKKLKEEKKIEEKKYAEKSKHIKAKVQHMKKGGRKKKFIPSEVEEATISKNIKKTLATSGKKRKYRKDEKEDQQADTKIVISEFTSVSELAKLMNVSATDIIGTFFKMGQMVTINQRLDKDTLEMICAEFEFDVEFQEEYGTDILEEKKDEHTNAELVGRPPIVTIMGHVDHGKTAILDYIRSANVIAGEAGGITQHIGAYQVDYEDRKITFIDTPGHEAFAAMRARGANVTDIVVIVVAANESVKKQTVEAIDHAKAAGVQIIVAINKIDLKDANIDRTIADLMKQNLMLEGYGGEILWVPCSAKTGEGINELLDTINLASEMKELKAPLDVPGKGIVIEAKKDQRMGTIITVLLQEGTISKGDSVVCGATYGKIRKLENERGNEIETVNPSDVAIIFGLNEVPKAGDIINQVENEKIARQISGERQHIRKERELYQAKTNLDNLFQKIKENEMSEIKLIVKADTDGSVEALCDSFQKLSDDEVMINIIRKGVGGINDADVNLASASDAIIIGFNVRVNNSAKKLSEEEKVEIKLYQIIYEAIEDLQKAMKGMLAPEFKEKIMGSAIIKQIFKIKKVGTIAGCYVEKGVITNSGLVRLYRNDILVHEGELSSLKHYADEVKQVKAGTDCGIGIKDFNDLKEGDIIENFVMEEVAR
ncbi:MAG: translation initiation factor IF-2 [Candidatus Cloacimonas sp. SDB]|nr:MAG: translation initiation factor IF-2 [Candidatus Cloacimonas sp. SDB]